MAENGDLEERVSILEDKIKIVAEDARAARHLAAAQDHEVSDLAVLAGANRAAISALGEQTAAGFVAVHAEIADLRSEMDRRFEQVDRRFEQVDRRFEQVDRGFAEMRARLDQTAAGMAQIAEMIGVLIERGEDGRPEEPSAGGD
ncbi:hypothetical protein FOE78_19285 [Microlunatus elymi]|uniref:Uncharacterized protein n=1 Tax=Microlunatus elymi TaxID=2596828 RepID=A0A516Q2X1_9ACTN|nr:hypothetical protein [Microlunatus elymi]QDP97766.1 hypothetical protein FOE78_19285 [Microlunatus elymi]